MTTITPEQRQSITDYVASHSLMHGVGTAEAACTIASGNYAMTGVLTDDIPDCMSPVIGRWIIGIQDAMPLDRLNGPRWKGMIAGAFGTGREHEAERLKLIMDWMWTTVLPQAQPNADAGGFGPEWRAMCNLNTAKAARAAAKAAWEVAGAAQAARAAVAARAARAERAARAARAAAMAAAEAYWNAVDPEALLDRLIAVGRDEK